MRGRSAAVQQAAGFAATTARCGCRGGAPLDRRARHHVQHERRRRHRERRQHLQRATGLLLLRRRRVAGLVDLDDLDRAIGAECGDHVLGGLEAVLRILLEALEHDRLEDRRQLLAAALRRRHDGLADVTAQDSRGRRRGEGRRAGEALVEHHAERVDVGCGPGLPLVRICSGAMYSGVPIVMPSRVRPCLSSMNFAMPKSRSFDELLAALRVRNMLSGLRSRWTMPARGSRERAADLLADLRHPAR